MVTAQARPRPWFLVILFSSKKRQVSLEEMTNSKTSDEAQEDPGVSLILESKKSRRNG